MIRVLFPPGCYGNFISQCIYRFTNLNTGVSGKFFDAVGSSHGFRQIQDADSKISCEHVDTFVPASSDQIVVVLADPDHAMDYYNNQFTKTWNNDIYQHLCVNTLTDKFRTKLFPWLPTDIDWSNNIDPLLSVSRGVLRELLSLEIQTQLDITYDRSRYSTIPHQAKVSAEDFFDNFSGAFAQICQALGLTITESDSDIELVHKEFLGKQMYHDSQHRCQTWTQNIVDGVDTPSPCLTFLDEAYVQHLLREQGWHIPSHEVEVFPETSQKLKNISYRK
jgi:hypothetical protein